MTMSKMIKELKRFLKEEPEEAKRIWEKIDKMDLQGPTVDEYFEFLAKHGMKQIKCTPGDLDDVTDKFENFSHFTIRNGKAKYHMFYLAENSCGLYYALRVEKDGCTSCKRAVEPTTEITCWGI